jgi:hypothetical protein
VPCPYSKIANVSPSACSSQAQVVASATTRNRIASVCAQPTTRWLETTLQVSRPRDQAAVRPVLRAGARHARHHTRESDLRTWPSDYHRIGTGQVHPSQ